MRFFEFEDPYYALIKAEDEDTAINMYIELVAEEDEEYLRNVVTEVNRDYALCIFSRSCVNNKKMSIKDLLDCFNANENRILTIDSNLA